jgi:hypothetical protein
VLGAGTVINPIAAGRPRGEPGAQLDFAKSRARSFQASVQSTWPSAARAIGDRSFSLSYADSLGAQGNAAAADRVRECVKRAGFRPAAMQRCRRLSDDLLFG